MTFCHWNLNYIAAHEFIIISLLLGYIAERTKIDWRKNSGVRIPQASVLDLLLFLIYRNDLTDGIMSIYKTFAENTSLFTKIIDTNSSQDELNSGLKDIKNWSYQWKMQFKMLLSFLGNQIHLHASYSYSIKFLLLHVLTKGTWVFFLIQN